MADWNNFSEDFEELAPGGLRLVEIVQLDGVTYVMVLVDPKCYGFENLDGRVPFTVKFNTDEQADTETLIDMVEDAAVMRLKDA